MKTIREIISFIQEVLKEWNDDKAPRMAAALAYFTIFSLAPLLIVVIAIAGAALGQQAVRGELFGQISGVMGEETAGFVEEMVANARQPNQSAIATVIGLVTLLLGAGGVFGQLQDALNTAWDVEPKPTNGIIALLKARFLSFAMVLGVGFLLLVSLVLTAVLASITGVFSEAVPGIGGVLAQIFNQILSFSVITVLFAMIYKYLPDTRIEWRDVWVGAAFTSLLFAIGKYLIGLYLGNSSVASSYGAAGSLIVILLWIFYSSQLLLIGAEFTQVWARRYGSRNPANAPAPIPAYAVSKTGQKRHAITAALALNAPTIYPLTEHAAAAKQRERKLLTAGVISYLSALFGLLILTKRRERGSMER